ncbi:DMT family transporter [Nocardioides sp.]|uniref:DMT family transporter n=1 Tax=Nocardioides sp. TaxID=35761 RepID=UPI003513A32E
MMCLASAAGFGLMAVLARAAYDDGVSVPTLLIVRFAIAAVVLLAVAAARGSLSTLGRRGLAVGLLLGGVGYALQSTFYFSALQHADAAIVALVFYAYPVLVMVVAVALGRESASVRRVGALGLAIAGTVLVLAGAATGSMAPLGVLLAAGAAVTYTCYIVVGDAVTRGLAPVPLSAIVCLGAAISFGLTGGVGGGLDLGFAPQAWVWLVAIALVSTVGSVLLFFAGLARVGPSTAALLSVLEPVVTVASAAVVLGEAPTLLQWGGGALVIAAVVVLQWRARPPVPPAEAIDPGLVVGAAPATAAR